MKDILLPLQRGFHKVVTKTKAFSPEILIGVGVVGTVTAAVLACKATLKLEDAISDDKKEILDIKTDYAEVVEEGKTHPNYKNYRKAIVQAYAKMGIDICKLYGPSVALGAASLGTVFTSNHIMRKRNAALCAACATVESAFERYRNNVVDTFGPEVDHDMRFGVKTEEIEVTEVDAKGKEKTVKKTVNVVNGSGIEGYSDYAKFFDEGCAEWSKDPEYNLYFLKARQKEMNDRLKAQGHLFLNEVYDKLGLPRTQAGQVVGWVYDPDTPLGDNYVDFGIYETFRERNRAFVNGLEPVILLDFNVDGVIVDKI